MFFPSNLFEIFHILRNSDRYYHKRIKAFTYSTCYSCHILIKPGFSRQIFEKSSNIKFHKNPSSGRKKGRFLQICERAYKPVN